MINFFDILVLILVALHSISGFREGLLRGVVKLAGFAAIAAGLFLFFEPIADAAKILPMPSSVSIPIVFVVLLIAGMVLTGLVAALIGKMVHLTPIGFVDSGFGAAFGMMKALLVAGMLAFFLSCASNNDFLHNQFTSSRTAPGLAGFVKSVMPFAARAGKAFSDRFAPLAAPDAPSPQLKPGAPSLPAPDSTMRKTGTRRDGPRGEKR